MTKGYVAFLILSLLLLQILIKSAHAALPGVIISQQKETRKVFNPEIPHESLREVSFRADQYKYNFRGEWNYGTRFFVSYRTDRVENLEDYGFVNFIRGGVFESCQNLKTGKVKYVRSVSRFHFDETVSFHHPQWVIDSIDSDPFYYSIDNNEKYPRHTQYRWNRDSNSYDKSSEVAYYNERPSQPELYIKDYPGGQAFLSTPFTLPNGERFQCAKNISLKLRACLYRTEDVPLKTRANDLNLAEPLTCFETISSFIYDHQLKKFTSPSELHPFVL